MKTRIIYPEKIWYNKTFYSLSNKATILAVYLVTNSSIGLCPIYELKDLKIMFDLRFTENQLEDVKQELIKSTLYDFYKEWVFIKNDFSYCDYFGRDRVMESKEKEESVIPTEVKDFFNRLTTSYKGVKKGLITPHKSKTINNKLEIKNKKPEYKNIDDIGDKEFEEIAKFYHIPVSKVADIYDRMYLWHKSTGKTYKNYKAGLMNWIRRTQDNYQFNRK